MLCILTHRRVNRLKKRFRALASSRWLRSKIVNTSQQTGPIYCTVRVLCARTASVGRIETSIIVSLSLFRHVCRKFNWNRWTSHWMHIYFYMVQYISRHLHEPASFITSRCDYTHIAIESDDRSENIRLTDWLKGCQWCRLAINIVSGQRKCVRM